MSCSDESSSEDEELRLESKRCPGIITRYQVIHLTQQVWYWPTERFNNVMRWRGWRERARLAARRAAERALGGILQVHGIQPNNALQPVTQPQQMIRHQPRGLRRGRNFLPLTERQMYVLLCEAMNTAPSPSPGPDPAFQHGYRVPRRRYEDGFRPSLPHHGGPGGPRVQRWYRWDRH